MATEKFICECSDPPSDEPVLAYRMREGVSCRFCITCIDCDKRMLLYLHMVGMYIVLTDTCCSIDLFYLFIRQSTLNEL